MAEEWFTAAALEPVFRQVNAALVQALGRPLKRSEALPTTERGIQLRADREGWQSRERAGKGGGREYHVSALPEAARLVLAREQVAQAVETGNIVPVKAPSKARSTAPKAPAAVSVLELPEEVQRLCEARVAAVRAYHAFRKTAGLADRRARPAFCAAWAARELPVEPWVYEAVPKFSKNTLRDWEARWQAHGLAGLAPQWGNRKGCGILDTDEELRTFVLGALTAWPHADATHVMQGLRARFPGRELPSLRTTQRFLADWKAANAQLLLKLTNPDAWRSKYKAAGGSRSEGITAPNMLWEMDSTPGDLLLADNYRHKLVGLIDVYTRRLRLHVSRQSTSAAVLSTLRGGILSFGKPTRLRIDNGADYVSRRARLAYDDLHIAVDLCPPFTPEAKPHIERAFRTFLHDLVEMLPGFVGHNVAERKDIEARKSFADRLMSKDEVVELRMTPEQLQEFCDRWCEDIYAHRPHGSLNGKTPWQMAAGWNGPILRIENPRALDVLLMPTDGDGRRVVTKKGIRIDSATYLDAGLGGWEGKPVKVLFDDADFGYVFVFSEDGEFICRACCPERTGVSRAEVAAAHKAKQSAVMREGMKELKAAQKAIRPDDMVADILNQAAVDAGKLAYLPQPSVPFTTPALEGAALAARAGQPAAPAQASVAERAAQAAIIADFATERAERRPPTDDEKYDRWLALEARVQAGETLGEDDARFHRLFGQSAAWSRIKQHREEIESFHQSLNATA